MLVLGEGRQATGNWQQAIGDRRQASGIRQHWSRSLMPEARSL